MPSFLPCTRCSGFTALGSVKDACMSHEGTRLYRGLLQSLSAAGQSPSGPGVPPAVSARGGPLPPPLTGCAVCRCRGSLGRIVEVAPLSGPSLAVQGDASDSVLWAHSGAQGSWFWGSAQPPQAEGGFPSPSCPPLLT